MSERKLTSKGTKIFFDRAVAPDANMVSQFLLRLDQAVDPVYLEHLFSSYPAFHVSTEEKTIALCYGLGHTPDVIEIALLLVDPDFKDEGIEEELLRLFEEKAKPWQNVVHFASKDAGDFWTRLAYTVLLETEQSLLLHRKL
jgi:N-acetylglutamate synthase-like GNAT family acetyltransferase